MITPKWKYRIYTFSFGLLLFCHVLTAFGIWCNGLAFDTSMILVDGVPGDGTKPTEVFYRFLCVWIYLGTIIGLTLATAEG